jgi:ubiquinol-cytochrome c reductase cytochrome c subunit
VNALAARRRHPAAIVVLLLLGLLVTGGLYSALSPRAASAATASPDQVAQGKKLFLANCATCHGLQAQGGSAGPTLVGVGAAAVDFQVGSGRMPLSRPGVQAPARDRPVFNTAQISQLAAYVASLGPGPAIPSASMTSGSGPGVDVAKGGQLFRTNCAMCHNYAGSGGALTRGKYAPSLRNVPGNHIYEAMLTGPQSMPVFNDTNLSPTDKNSIIGYLHSVDHAENVGGMDLGNLGPLSEGLFMWVFGIGITIACAVWLGSKAA